MTDTNHQNELKALKSKAYGVLKAQGILSALETIIQSYEHTDDLLEKFSSPIVKASPNKNIESQHENKHWEHRAYLLGGVQTIQISYFSEYDSWSDDMTKRATLYVLNNKETVLYDKGNAQQRYNEWGSDPWKFSDFGAIWLEVVKLNKVWMGAVTEIASELERVKKLEEEERYRADELKAEKEKSNFDLGDFE